MSGWRTLLMPPVRPQSELAKGEDAHAPPAADRIIRLISQLVHCPTKAAIHCAPRPAAASPLRPGLHAHPGSSSGSPTIYKGSGQAQLRGAVVQEPCSNPPCSAPAAAGPLRQNGAQMMAPRTALIAAGGHTSRLLGGWEAAVLEPGGGPRTVGGYSSRPSSATESAAVRMDAAAGRRASTPTQPSLPAPVARGKHPYTASGHSGSTAAFRASGGLGC